MQGGLFALVLVAVGAGSLVVTTEYGPVRGAVRNGVALAWLNVPFASAPRFQPPAPPLTWTPVVRDASVFGVGCPQDCFVYPQTCPRTTSEDCLQLNVFAPGAVAEGSGPLPVLLYLPGGDYVQGLGSNFVSIVVLTG